MAENFSWTIWTCNITWTKPTCAKSSRSKRRATRIASNTRAHRAITRRQDSYRLLLEVLAKFARRWSLRAR